MIKRLKYLDHYHIVTSYKHIFCLLLDLFNKNYDTTASGKYNDIKDIQPKAYLTLKV